MNPLVLQFGNGNMFFVGMCIAVLVCGLSLRFSDTRARCLLAVLCIVGAVAAVLTSTPLPTWAYVLWLLGLLGFLVLLNKTSDHLRKARTVAVGLFSGLSLVLCLMELPYHRRPAIPFPKDRPIHVIGDSLAAGTESRVDPWPVVLGKLSGFHVINLAVPGNRAGPASDQAKSITDETASVLLEIGGNDLLDRTPVALFEADLEQLLAGVCRPGRVVAMFELPLPPLHNDFGRIQRTLAASHGVILIPKRYMTRVFGTRNATVDGLHLSESGHKLMAEIVRGLIDSGKAANE